MRIHELKTWPCYFEAIWYGVKPFEIRYNDRDYKPGDMLILKEYDITKNSFSGREITVSVTYCMDDIDGEDFVKEGFVVMGIREVSRKGERGDMHGLIRTLELYGYKPDKD